MLKALLKKIYNENENLTYFGIEDSSEERYGINRKHMLTDEAFVEFSLCYNFLKKCKKRKTVNSNIGSYFLKHVIEKWENHYISNGMVIAAVIALGLKYNTSYKSPNIVIGISERCEQYKAAYNMYMSGGRNND